MKELLEKFFWVFADGISLLKEDKSDEAIKKFEEASEMKSSIKKEASKESLSEENIEKYFETDKGKESIKKYVDMYMSSNDVSSFMDQIKWWSKRGNGLTTLYLATFDFGDELEKKYEKLKFFFY